MTEHKTVTHTVERGPDGLPIYVKTTTTWTIREMTDEEREALNRTTPPLEGGVAGSRGDG